MSTNDEAIRSFLSRHRLLLKRERDAEVERSSLLLSNCGPKLLEQKGLALVGLGIVSVNIGLGGKTLVELERPTAYHTSPLFPPHTFRPGDLARIEENVSASSVAKKVTQRKKSEPVARSTTAAEGIVYKVSDVRIVVALDLSESSGEDLDLPERCRILKLANSVTYDRMDKAFDQLEKIVLSDANATNEKHLPQMTSLIRVLLGLTTPSERIPVQNLKFFDEGLNPSQQEAIRFALESPEVACIHGPPGTGKTHTLIEIIRQLSLTSSPNQKPNRLLVCGASNLSVDNILERLLALPPPASGERLKVTRVGHPARVMAHQGVLDATLDVKAGRSDQAALAKDVRNELDTALGILSGKGKGAKGKGPRGAERKKMWEEVKALRKEYRLRESGVVKTVLNESQIVLATCHSAGGRQLWNQDFDVVIIDEATQALEAVCWIPIFKAKKLILAGDPKQLPPTILSIDKHRKTKNDKSTKILIPKGEKRDQPTKTIPEDTAPEPDGLLVSSNSSDVSASEASEDDGSISGIEETKEVQQKPSKVSTLKSTERPTRQRPGLRPPRTLETTLFDRLEKMYGPGVKRMLNVQYRMHAQIAEFPSKAMYQSKLTSHDSVSTHLLLDLPNARTNSEDEAKEILGTPVIFFDTAGCEYFERIEGDNDEGSRCNENEASVVKMWVDQLLGAGVLPSQIAIIAPYQAQVLLLTSLLRPTYSPELEIGTVDGMQGREKDAVIISLVRSNEKREVGFLKDKRRLNVAMTRAKRHLCIIGDSSTVKYGGSFLKKWLAWLDVNADVRYGGLE